MSQRVARFAFPLEALLAQRRRAEEECRHRVASALRAVEAACVPQRRLGNLFRSQASALSNGTLLGGTALRVHGAFLELAMEWERRADAGAAQKRAQLGRERSALHAATRERRILERLRERRFAVYTERERRAEQRELDDANAGRYRAPAVVPWMQSTGTRALWWTGVSTPR
jgi:flagellar export protein FliJ